jgi:hypothetical protein
MERKGRMERGRKGRKERGRERGKEGRREGGREERKEGDRGKRKEGDREKERKETERKGRKQRDIRATAIVVVVEYQERYSDQGWRLGGSQDKQLWRKVWSRQGQKMFLGKAGLDEFKEDL